MAKQVGRAPGRSHPSASPSGRRRAARSPSSCRPSARRDGGHRAAGAEMADDEPRDRHLVGCPLHREAVEAVAADPHCSRKRRGHGVRRRPLRDRRVEGRVEHRHVRHVRQRRARLVDRRQRRAVVQRRELAERVELARRTSSSISAGSRSARRRARCDGRPRGRPATSSSDPTRLRCRRRRRRASLRLVEPALTTRITPQSGHAQSRIAGSSSPCSRVYARASSRASPSAGAGAPRGPRARARGRSRRSRDGSGRGR